MIPIASGATLKWGGPLTTGTLAAIVAAIDPAVAAAGITTLGTVAGGWLVLRQKRNETRIERQANDTDKLSTLVDQLQEQLKTEFANSNDVRSIILDQMREISDLRTENAKLRVGAIKLVGQLETADIEPTWRPR